MKYKKDGLDVKAWNLRRRKRAAASTAYKYPFDLLNAPLLTIGANYNRKKK
jgi:hypothetical protein